MIDTLLFDLGNVLVRWDPRHHYRDRFDTADAMESFLAEVCPPSWNHEMDLGKPFAVAIAERQALFPQHAALIAEWRTGWERMLGGEIDEMVALLPRLEEAGYGLHALTNWSAETFPVARRRFPWLRTFGHITVSGELGLAKPDARIFELALTRADRRPSRVLFIDDSGANVEAAASLGIHAIQFHSPSQCIDALRQDGIRVGGPLAGRRCQSRSQPGGHVRAASITLRTVPRVINSFRDEFTGTRKGASPGGDAP